MATTQEMLCKISSAVDIASKTPREPEKKLRELVSDIWEQYIKEKRINLNLNVVHELSLANGRADTVFNRLVLEYKKPGTIHPNVEKNRKLISQVQGYILDVAKEHRFSKDRLLGVVFDGNYFLFMRYGKMWRVDDPLPVNEKSLNTFLLNLEKLTAKKALIPENLIRDFAIGKESRNKVAADCVKAFYTEIALHGASGDTKEHVFFEQWKIQYAEVHGSLEQKKINNQTLFTSYGFSKKEQEHFNEYAFFFALDTYYALLMKLLSYQVVGFYTMKDLTGVPLENWKDRNSEELKEQLAKLEEGGIFRELGIRNYLEGDLFSWYIQAWQDDMFKAIRQMIDHLDDYDPQTMEIAPDETRDILKKLYQYLVPREIRHDLGEYYTPDWLAERCLNQLMYNGDPKYCILDPGCGSGTFPILAIKRAKKYADDHKIAPRDALKSILKNIFGFDLNPMAVISSRTNYLLAIADLLKYRDGEITIPIYLCDSILPPESKIMDDGTIFKTQTPYTVKTSVGNFEFSQSIVNKQRVQEIALLLEESVKSRHMTTDFLQRVKTRLALSDDEFDESKDSLAKTFEKLLELDIRGINGVWARIIKNSFAPLFVGTFHFIVGNPPWVNWDSLPEEYRNRLLPLNHNVYELFPHTGLAARHGAGKIDLSTLMFYVSTDKYLKMSGKICFVITQTVFKSSGGSKGFRKFHISTSNCPIKIEQVDDMVDLNPFEGATNRTAIFCAIKGRRIEYPVPYLFWKRLKKGRISMDLSLDDVLKITKRIQLDARPIDSSDRQSSWLAAKPKAIKAINNAIGNSIYTAHAGTYTGGANGVYWINILEKYENTIKIQNLYDSGKRKIESLAKEIEPDLVYPLLRGKELQRWTSSTEHYIIVPQDNDDPKNAIPEPDMQKNYPLTYSYFTMLKDSLGERKSQVVRDLADSQAFYFMYSVKKYTQSPYKIAWKYIASDFACAVISNKDDPFLGRKLIMPDHRVIIIGVDSREEAHFVCSVLNSIIARFIVRAYCVGTQLAPHIMNNILVPKYQRDNCLHNELARLSEICHSNTEKGVSTRIEEELIDLRTAELFNIDETEMNDIKISYEVL